MAVRAQVVGGKVAAFSLVVTALLLVVVQFSTGRARRLLLKLDQVPDERRQQWMTLLQVAHWGLNALIIGSSIREIPTGSGRRCGLSTSIIVPSLRCTR